MIEALVGMLLIAAWLLSNAGLQVSSIKYQAGAAGRYSAVALASELGERMEGNLRGATSGAYALATTATPTSAALDCEQIACPPAALAEYDLAQWTARVAADIKRVKAISVVNATTAGGLVTYTISISWEEPKGRQSYETAASGAAAVGETMSYVTSKVMRNAV